MRKKSNYIICKYTRQATYMHGHLHGHKSAQTTNVLNIQTLQRKECFHMLCRCINKLNHFSAQTQHFESAVELSQQKYNLSLKKCCSLQSFYVNSVNH